MFTVAMENMFGEKGIIYSSDPSYASEKRNAYDFRPVVKNLNKSGSFGFTVPKSNPLYDSIYRIGTNIYVRQDGRLIFVGRVLDVSRDTYCNKIVSCEGALAFLNDIIAKPFVYADPLGHVIGSTVTAHFSKLMGEYNAACCPLRILSSNVGTLPSYFNDIEAYSVSGITDYITVKEAIDDILGIDPSVALCVSYLSDAPLLVLSELPYGTVAPADGRNSFETGVNIVDLSEESAADDIFTHIIPVGDNNITTDSEEIDRTLSSSLISKYGRIDKVVHFDGAKTETELEKAIARYKKYFTNIDEPRISLTAVDIKYLGAASDMVDVGLSAPIRSAQHGIRVSDKYVCTEASINLENPDTSSYVFETYN